jgi:hypothetical protein
MKVAAAPNTGGSCDGNGGSFSAAVPAPRHRRRLPGVKSNAVNVFTLCTYTIDVTALNAATAPVPATTSRRQLQGVAYATSNSATLTIVKHASGTNRS